MKSSNLTHDKSAAWHKISWLQNLWDSQVWILKQSLSAQRSTEDISDQFLMIEKNLGGDFFN